MTVYFYTTQDYEGILITHKDLWISFTDDCQIDHMYCTKENAPIIGLNFKLAIKSGIFDEYEFKDWYHAGKYNSTPYTSGIGVKDFLEHCKYYYIIS